MKRRRLGRTGLDVSPIAMGGAPLGYVNKASGWDPYTSEGRKVAIAAVHRALDRGINYIDTAPAYANGHSESIVGDVMKTRRNDCVLASKLWYDVDRQGALDSVHDSLKRLQTDHIDIMQVHTRWLSQSEADFVVHGGMLDALRLLCEEGKIRFIGITSEEPLTLLPFLKIPEFDVYQISYNFIYQSAALHFLPEAAKADVGVVAMRTMTSGIMQWVIDQVAPEWKGAHDPWQASLRFVVGDSRIHSGIIGMRWAEEVDRNIAMIEDWSPPINLAQAPRTTIEGYRRQDGLEP
jgi:aryl-alcohol dehydrogenase-like predicted oxidoreductase